LIAGCPEVKGVHEPVLVRAHDDDGDPALKVEVEGEVAEHLGRPRCLVPMTALTSRLKPTTHPSRSVDEENKDSYAHWHQK